MKAKLLLALVISISVQHTLAQPYPAFNTIAYIDVANIKAGHLVHGDLYWHPTQATSLCEWPKGSGKNVAFNTALWISAHDTASNLKVSTQTYRQNGNDYWPGPIDIANTTTAQKYNASQAWARIWKINSEQIDSFTHNLYSPSNIPADIVEWPAKGNPSAKGAAGVSLVINQDMAPFVDKNGDGIYSVSNGDYPRIKGDQMLWWIINDDGPFHNETISPPLQIEIRNSAYAYKRGGVLDNIIFYEYLVKSKSPTTYTDFRLGLLVCGNLGDGRDDYVGFDSTNRMGITYNGNAVDGNGEPYAYGANPPMAAVTLLDLPGDLPNSYLPAGSFTTFASTVNTPNGTPIGSIERDRLLRSQSRIGNPYPNNASYGYKNDSECRAANIPGGRQYVIASNSFSLAQGETKKIAWALVVADSAGGCPNMNFGRINSAADVAWTTYHNPPAHLLVNPSVVASKLHIYPNPANSEIYVDDPDTPGGTVSVRDALGRTVLTSVTKQAGRFAVETNSLSAGIYYIMYKSGTFTGDAKFVKE
jgi:hypothetical protein